MPDTDTPTPATPGTPATPTSPGGEAAAPGADAGGVDVEQEREEGASAIEDALADPNAPSGEDLESDATPTTPNAPDALNLTEDDRLATRERMLAAFAAASGETPATPGDKPPEKPPEKNAATPAPAAGDDLKGVREFFVEEYGDEAAKRIDPLLKVIEEQRAQLSETAAFVRAQKEAQAASYEREVHGFFDGVLAKLPGRDKAYGSSANLDPAAAKAREQVHYVAVRKLQESREAAAANPKLAPLTPEQAMRWADQIVHGPIAAETKSAARAELEKNILRRHQSRTFTPSAAPAKRGGPQTPEDHRKAGADAIAAVLMGS